MSPYIIGGLIGVIGTVVIWCLTAWREHAAEQNRQREYSRLVLKGALVDYLAALDAVTQEAVDQPAPAIPNVADRTFERLLEKLGLMWVVIVVVRVLQRIAYGRRPAELTDRMAAASAHLRLVAPPDVLALMEEVDSFFATKAARSSYAEWKDDWRVVRTKLRKDFRGALND